MTQLRVLPLGLTAAELANLKDFCRLASRRSCTWSISDTIDQATGVLAHAKSENLLAACQHYDSVGGCILLLDSGLCAGITTVKGPLQLSGAFFAFDYFQRHGKNNDALAEHLAAQDLLKSFAGASALAATSRTTLSNERKLPPAATPARIEKLPKADVRLLNAAPANQKPSVLIVDDSEVAQKYMENNLHSLGHACDLASSGDEALVMLSRHAYKYVFLDVNMTGLDGYQTCRAIKSFNGHASTPNVFMTTSRVGAIDKIRGTLAGCDAYLTKPINQVQLWELLSRLDLVAAPRAKHEQTQPLQPLRRVQNGPSSV